MPVRIAALGLALLWTAATPVLAQQDLVPIKIKVDTIYDASNVEKLAVIQDLLPPRVVSTRTIPGRVVLDQFGVGETQLAEVHKSLLEKVLRLNDTDAAQFQIGRNLLPQIPPRSNAQPNRALAKNQIPRLASFLPADLQKYVGRFGVEEVVFREGARITNDANVNALATVIFAWVPRRFVEENRAVFEKDEIASVLGTHFVAKTAAASCGDALTTSVPAGLLAPEDRKRITGLLTRARREVPLVIFDEGWPGADEYEASMKALREMARTVRKANLLSPLSFTDDTRIAAGRASVQPHPHAQAISRSLAELAALDKHGLIKVVFLPYNLELPGVRDVFDELLTIFYLSQYMGDDFGRRSFDPLSNERQKELNASIAAQVKALLDSVMEERKRLKLGNSEFLMNWAMVRAVLLLNARLGYAGERAGIVNFSWTSREAPYSFDSHKHTLVITAAGNDSQDIYDADTKVFLAKRSLAAADTLAVLNGSNKGRYGGSSCFGPERLSDAFAVTFDGRVGTTSGTSFAAPRVAWFLALRESLRERRIDDNWQVSTRDWIRNIRPPGGGSIYERTWFDISRAFPEAQDPAR